MNLQILAKRIAVGPTLEDRIERRMYFALGRFSSAIRSVILTLCDENGPRGGIDKTCRIMIKLRGAQDVIVEGRDHRLERVVNRTADRAGRAVARSIGLRRKKPVVRASGRIEKSRANLALSVDVD